MRNTLPESQQILRADGLHVWLEGDAQPYVDLVQGFSTTNWGHRHPEVVQTALRALPQIDHVTGVRDPVHEEVSARLIRGAGIPNGETYFDVGGAQIVRLAMHAAVVATGRQSVACLRGCFHGYGCSGALLERTRI